MRQYPPQTRRNGGFTADLIARACCHPIRRLSMHWKLVSQRLWSPHCLERLPPWRKMSLLNQVTPLRLKPSRWCITG
jgi:hypothetical protein